ncbi:hypothetical protein MUB24_06430 [Lederbergia sp. NSJ-179]|uniref:hypothetical protein n=1 Tax=Lederbergia sp. NSJ-179 TaxID=2931402 RepID=UPI001FD61726|nr:hypothetical protein [Lederbergia sp. NSJ-179]MCJ7840549.1 hypothetical protein [Lederbergia sp. NSJ-179]
MKIALYMIVSCLILVASYFLYQQSLGAIPFLIGSIFLFFLVIKINASSKKEIGKIPPEERKPDKSNNYLEK